MIFRDLKIVYIVNLELGIVDLFVLMHLRLQIHEIMCKDNSTF